MELDRISSVLCAAQRQILAEKRKSLVHNAAALDSMSPLKVLARGYLVASDENGRMVRSVREVAPGKRLQLRFRDGRAECVADRVEVE